MVKLRNFLLRKVYNIFKDHCYEMFVKIGYEMFIQNRQVTKCPSYKMLGYEMIRLRDRCYTSCGYEMFITKCPSYDMCGNPKNKSK